MLTLRERIEGGIWGLLMGDALGVPYEFHPPSQIPPKSDIELDPPLDFRRAHATVPPGTWSDDGAHALCLLASLLERGRLDVEDLGQRLLAWYDGGYLAVDGKVFDCGVQTGKALQALRRGVPARGTRSASIRRLSPASSPWVRDTCQQTEGNACR